MKLSEQGLYIHGKRTKAKSGETFESINPANGEVNCQVQIASKSDVDDAVISAQKGFEEWSNYLLVGQFSARARRKQWPPRPLLSHCFCCSGRIALMVINPPSTIIRALV